MRRTLVTKSGGAQQYGESHSPKVGEPYGPLEVYAYDDDGADDNADKPMQCYGWSFVVQHKYSGQTEADAVRASGLQHQRDDGNDGEDDARHEQVDDVVDGFALQMNGESDARVRRLTAVVIRQRLRHWNI